MWNLLCQYNNIYAGSYKYLKEKKVQMEDWRKKKKKVANQNGTVDEQWKTMYEQCKKYCRKKSTNRWLRKNKNK